MRVGVITTSYPRHAGDHAGNFVGAHVRALRALGHEVEVIAAGEPSEADDVTRIASPLFYRGGAPEILERSGARALGDAAAFTARLVAKVARRARAGRWDAAIAHWLAPSAIAAAVALPRRMPLLAIGHGGDIHTLRRMHLLGPMLRMLRLRGAELAVVSDELRAVCAPHMTAIVQPMGLDVAHFAALGRARTPTTPPTVAFIGRWVPVKGVDVLFEAMPFIETPASIVFGTPQGPVGVTHIELYNGGRHRQDHRYLTTPEQRDQILREASVLVVPSRVLPNGRSEGTPLVALEALAAGVPVVASRVGGLAELPVVLVPPEDPRALAAAIDRVLAAPPPVASVAHLDWRIVAARLLPRNPDSSSQHHDA